MIINEHHFFLLFHIGRDKSLRGNNVIVAHQKVHWLHLLVALEGALCPSQAQAQKRSVTFTGPNKVHQKVQPGLVVHQAGALVQVQNWLQPVLTNHLVQIGPMRQCQQLVLPNHWC